MSIKAAAQIRSVQPYDESNYYTEVQITSMRNGEYMDTTNQLFVLPISADLNSDVCDAVRTWTSTNWGVSWDLVDTVFLLGGGAVFAGAL